MRHERGERGRVCVCGAARLDAVGAVGPCRARGAGAPVLVVPGVAHARGNVSAAGGGPAAPRRGGVCGAGQLRGSARAVVVGRARHAVDPPRISREPRVARALRDARRARGGARVGGARRRVAGGAHLPRGALCARTGGGSLVARGARAVGLCRRAQVREGVCHARNLAVAARAVVLRRAHCARGPVLAKVAGVADAGGERRRQRGRVGVGGARVLVAANAPGGCGAPRASVTVCAIVSSVARAVGHVEACHGGRPRVGGAAAARVVSLRPLVRGHGARLARPPRRGGGVAGVAGARRHGAAEGRRVRVGVAIREGAPAAVCPRGARGAGRPRVPAIAHALGRRRGAGGRVRVCLARRAQRGRLGVGVGACCAGVASGAARGALVAPSRARRAGAAVAARVAGVAGAG
mmetsp:Transcript_36061/g.84412  ORF Transcript_36061/g.84412 Transcript_36061/m.84412 type:complete len:408 (-) Transcript_36061:121-1344(-)